MKNLNLKPLYIFLTIVAVAALFKIFEPKKGVDAVSYSFEKTGKYVNSFDEDMHEQAQMVKDGKEELRKEAAKKEMDVIFPDER
jgi:hypothetical protein